MGATSRNGNGTSRAHSNGVRRAAAKSIESSAVEEEVLAAEDSADDEVLSKEEKLGMSKARAGFEKHVKPMFDVYRSEPEELGTSLDVKQLWADFKAWKASAGDEAKAAAEHARIKGQRLVLITGVWRGVLEIYGKALSSRVLKTHATIESFRKFMALGPRSKPESATSGASK